MMRRLLPVASQCNDPDTILILYISTSRSRIDRDFGSLIMMAATVLTLLATLKVTVPMVLMITTMERQTVMMQIAHQTQLVNLLVQAVILGTLKTVTAFACQSVGLDESVPSEDRVAL